MNMHCSKKEDTVTSLRHTAEPWVEINFNENFGFKSKIERSLIAEASMRLFHLSSQMSLTSRFPENLNTIFDSKNIFRKKEQCQWNTSEKVIRISFVFYKTYPLRTRASIQDDFRRIKASNHISSEPDSARYVSHWFYFILIFTFPDEQNFSCINSGTVIQSNIIHVRYFLYS